MSFIGHINGLGVDINYCFIAFTFKGTYKDTMH